MFHVKLHPGYTRVAVMNMPKIPLPEVLEKASYHSFSVFQVSHSPECQDVLRFLGNWCGAPQNPSYSFN